MDSNLEAPPFWGTSRAARALELSELRTRQLADQGKLRAIRTADGRRLFDPREVIRFREWREARRAP
jgi:hypothetical protein